MNLGPLLKKDSKKKSMLFHIPIGETVYFNTDNFECFWCGKVAKGVRVEGKTTNEYQTVHGLRRRRIINTVKHGPACECYPEIWMSDTEVESRLDDEYLQKQIEAQKEYAEALAAITEEYEGSAIKAKKHGDSLALIKASRGQYEAIAGTEIQRDVALSRLEKSFFVKVGLSTRGKMVGLQMRTDGIYTKSGLKLCNAIIPAK